MKNANGEEKSATRAKRTKTPTGEASKEPPRPNFSFSDEKEVIGGPDMQMKNNLV
jgi:hypothetical protein